MAKLLIEPEAFSESWRLGDGKDPYPIPRKALTEDYHAEEGYERVFVPRDSRSSGGPSASHKMLRYLNEWQAAEAFVLDHPTAFYDFARVTPWREPDGWSYHSSNADQFRFACADFKDSFGSETLCVAMARYDEFISVFSTDILPDSMTLEDVERILEAIDEHITLHLAENSK